MTPNRKPSRNGTSPGGEMRHGEILAPSRPGIEPKSFLEAALAYAARGWSIIPIRDKKAAGRWKQFQTLRPDAATLTRMFQQRDITGLAVLLGSASGGLACRDFDTLEGYERWAKDHPQLAEALPTVETARGRHVYFRGPEGFHNFGDGEYRGDPGHYCLLPPSRHPSGHIYRWLIPLPQGDLPAIDPVEAGLCNTENTANAAHTENTANAAHTENTANTDTLLESSVFSAPSVLQAVEKAISGTLPYSNGQRYKCLFRLARHLKGIESLNGADLSNLRPIVQEFHRRALPAIRTKEFLETWADFVLAWKRVKFPVGQGVIETAFKRAMASVTPTKATELYGAGPIALLAKLCRELQFISGSKEFYLDCRTAGRLIGVDHTSAWR